MAIERDEQGRLLPGSVLNPNGNTTTAAWNKLKKRIGDDLDELYTAAKDLIKSTDSDAVRANILLTLMGMIKPKTEIEDDTGEIVSIKAYHQALNTVVIQAAKIKELESKGKIPKPKRTKK